MSDVAVKVDFDMELSARIKNLPAPAAPNDAARKADVDAAAGMTIGRVVAVSQNLPLM